MKKVVIFGAGVFARVAHFYFCADSTNQVVAFTVHDRFIKEKTFRGLDVIPFEMIEKAYPPDQYAMFVAIGYRRVNKVRAEVYNQCKTKGYELVTYINSRNSYWKDLEIGDNCFVFDNNTIHPFVRIGNNVVVGSGNQIGHDSIVGDHCYIAAHAVITGGVRIGPYCFIGANATFRDGVTVARECIIGAGAVILKDTVERGVYMARNAEQAAVESGAIGDLCRRSGM
jgi:sugar O-acyltransferase (sialic acid O-acetyltransferase NeuD family)